MPEWLRWLVGLNLLLAAFLWIGEPVVIETGLPPGITGVSFLNFILVEDLADTGTLNHEYVHYWQQAILTPIGSGLIYLPGAAYSLAVDGNIWSSNPMELLAFALAPYDLGFKPRIVWRW